MEGDHVIRCKLDPLSISPSGIQSIEEKINWLDKIPVLCDVRSHHRYIESYLLLEKQLMAREGCTELIKKEWLDRFESNGREFFLLTVFFLFFVDSAVWSLLLKIKISQKGFGAEKWDEAYMEIRGGGLDMKRRGKVEINNGRFWLHAFFIPDDPLGYALGITPLGYDPFEIMEVFMDVKDLMNEMGYECPDLHVLSSDVVEKNETIGFFLQQLWDKKK